MAIDLNRSSAMKSRKWCWVLVTLAVLVILPGCLGPGNAAGHLGKWNKTQFETKWAQEGVFILVFPAYLVCGVGDILIFNSIQWWTGENPISSPSGDNFQVL
jgi:hypothetical protein